MKSGRIWLLAESFVYIRKCIQEPAAGGWFPFIYSCTKYHMHKCIRNLSRQCYSLYQYNLPALTETFPCCFWAFTVGSNIICHIFDPNLKHRPVSSGNKRGVSHPLFHFLRNAEESQNLWFLVFPCVANSSELSIPHQQFLVSRYPFIQLFWLYYVTIICTFWWNTNNIKLRYNILQ